MEAEVKEKPKVINQKTVRFSDAPWYKPGIPVIIGGVGAIGSHLAYTLGRQECELYLFDMDVVDEVNIAGQLYPTNSIGKKKTDITKEMIKLLSGNTNVELFGEFTNESMTGEYMFSAFDSLKARKTFFDAWCKIDSKDKVFIDGRTSGDCGQVFCVKVGDEDRYREYLFDDSEVKDLACSFKSTTYWSTMIASLMTAVFNNYMGNKVSGIDIADFPFLTEYNLQLFKFDITN